jgi:RsiW-degrading membrane proteinase PrsW (M82 family)
MEQQSQVLVKRHDRSLLRSSLVTFIGLAVFLVIVYLVELVARPQFSTTGIIIAGVLMSLVPAVLWLAFFYQQDRREPEPKGLVIEVFILGGLLAAAIGIPLVENVFAVSSWMYDNFWVNLAGAVLVIGFTQEFLKYAAVRFSVYSLAEFDERTDGIIYATAAGLGFASVLNIAFIVNSGGANLGMAAIRIVLTSLAQASFAGITGYFLGVDKLDHKPAWWMPVGVLLAAVLNGLFFTLWGNLTAGRINSSGGFVNPWIGLVLAVVLAVSVMAVLSWLIRRYQVRSAQKES